MSFARWSAGLLRGFALAALAAAVVGAAPSAAEQVRSFGRLLAEAARAQQPISRNPDDYWPGDIVAYLLPGELPHIGIVGESRAHVHQRPLLIHNIGAGAQIEDVLFAHRITGHYRWE